MTLFLCLDWIKNLGKTLEWTVFKNGTKTVKTKNNLIIACGALSYELNLLKKLNKWEHLTIQCLDAKLHNTPKLIPGKVKEKLDAINDDYDGVFIAYADCGTGGLLDALLEPYNVERLPGAHCYEFFSGQKIFEELCTNEMGTFYLTDFLVKHFNRLVIKGLGLDKHPELQKEYFGNYKKVVYLAQSRSETLIEESKQCAEFLGLEHSTHYTGLGNFKKHIEESVGVKH